MSYLVLARKFRPQTFAEVSGQEHVTRTLANAISRNRVAHAYLFAGPRGVGKTSIARIFAKALNCTRGPTLEPCGKCSNCKEIAQGTNLAVREIDGASHNSVDNVRELIESFRALPPPGSLYKIYIIDEVHMLSISAFNALLKSLEEPPPHTVFILATTDSHKIPETVISRCQRHDFRTISQREIISRLSFIAAEEKIKIEPEALRMIARLSEGSMRDAQSLLDRVHSFCDGAVSATEVGKVLGTVERSVLFRLSEAVLGRDAAGALQIVSEIFMTGIDPTLLLREFVAHFRDLLVVKLSAFQQDNNSELESNSQEEQDLLKAQVAEVSLIDMQDLLQLAREGADASLRSAYPKYSLEALVVRLATREPMKEISAILSQLDTISQFAATNSAAFSSRESVGGVVNAVRSKNGEAAQPSTSPPVEGEKTAKTAFAGVLDWGSFVQFVSEKGAHMLVEQLKRLIIHTFVAGDLRAQGPEFSVAYLKEDEHRTKLERLLRDFSKHERWSVKVERVVDKAPSSGSSLHVQEEERRKATTIEKKNDIQNHPKIKSLQKAFPGSKIENIRLKD